MNITLLDTSIATDNLGDEIIMDAIESVVRGLLPDAYTYKTATHEYMTGVSRKILKRSKLSFVCGTNILQSHMAFRSQWKLQPWDIKALGNAILCGAGWRTYGTDPDPYTRWLLKRVLRRGSIHSVRDRYTAAKLAKLGLSVVNTSCPTLWNLSPARCAVVPARKADAVLTTLTWYKPEPVMDKAMFECLTKSYKETYFWPQQSEDAGYFRSLGVSGIKLIPPSLKAYDRFLDTVNTDYIGLRLHGGIRCLQKGRRSLIIPVDNRATEISRDTGLPIMARNNIEGIKNWISMPKETMLNLPTDAIEQWKGQFAKPENASYEWVSKGLSSPFPLFS